MSVGASKHYRPVSLARLQICNQLPLHVHLSETEGETHDTQMAALVSILRLISYLFFLTIRGNGSL